MFRNYEVYGYPDDDTIIKTLLGDTRFAESPDSWSFDVPGYKKDEIKIEIVNNVVDIRAENKTRGKLNHSFGLGQDVDVEKITTKLEDGVLTLNLPKTEKAKPRQIAIG